MRWRPPPCWLRAAGRRARVLALPSCPAASPDQTLGAARSSFFSSLCRQRDLRVQKARGEERGSAPAGKASARCGAPRTPLGPDRRSVPFRVRHPAPGTQAARNPKRAALPGKLPVAAGCAAAAVAEAALGWVAGDAASAFLIKPKPPAGLSAAPAAGSFFTNANAPSFFSRLAAASAGFLMKPNAGFLAAMRTRGGCQARASSVR